MNFKLHDIRQHKRRRIAAMAFSLCALLFGIFTFLLFDDIHKSTVNNPALEHSENTKYAAADVFGVMFVLREYNGRIAVLNSLESQVLEILDICADSLDDPTRAELDGGICITSVSELVSVISSFENNASLS